MKEGALPTYRIKSTIKEYYDLYVYTICEQIG